MRVELKARVVGEDGTAYDFESSYNLGSMFALYEALGDFATETVRFLIESQSKAIFRSGWNAKKLKGRRKKP